MDREASGLHTVHGVTKSWAQLEGLSVHTRVCLSYMMGWGLSSSCRATGLVPLPPECAQGMHAPGLEVSMLQLPLSLQRVRTVTDALAGAISTRELVSLPLEYVHQGVCWQWQPPPQSEVGPGSQLTSLPQSLHPFTGNGSPCPVGRSTRAGGAGTGAR